MNNHHSQISQMVATSLIAKFKGKKRSEISDVKTAVKNLVAEFTPAPVAVDVVDVNAEQPTASVTEATPPTTEDSVPTTDSSNETQEG